MRAIIFTCSVTNMMVQQWLEDDESNATNQEFQGIICPACSQLHFINRKTGQLLGQDGRQRLKSRNP